MKLAKVLTFLFVAFSLLLSGCVAATPEAVVDQPADPQSGMAATADNSATSAPEVVTEVKIGALLPLTGGDAINGQNQKYGHEFAVEQINAAGGIKCLGGAKLTMVYGDSAGKPEAGNAETIRLIEEENVTAIMGAFHTGVTLTASETAERYGVPFIVPNSDVSARNLKYVFQTASTIQSMAEDSAEFAAQMGGAKTAIILTPNIAFGDWFKEDWREVLPAQGFEVVGEISFPSGSSDFGPTILSIKQLDPDLIFTIANTSDATLMLRQMKELNYWPKVGFITAAGGYADPSLIQNLGADAEGIYLTNDWFPNINLPNAKEINEQFKAKYGMDMIGNINTTYAGTLILADALEQACSTDPEVLAQTLRSMHLTEGSWDFMYTEVQFDDQGFNKFAGNFVAQIRDGETMTVWPAEFSVADPVWPVPSWKSR
ncbi:MAG TPA: ABC transporter substrate-binding protein [Bellilinea sp.]|nr:ABC transporter substrate-binding protein [Bellilinea sp.]